MVVLNLILMKHMGSYKIVPTTIGDIEKVFWLFDETMKVHEKDGYKVWVEFDKTQLTNDIQNQLQFKVVENEKIVAIFSVQYNDELLWGAKCHHNAIYLHRIVTHPEHKGNRQFAKILKWAKEMAKSKGLDYVRMDTWADNEQLINYYLSYGFKFVKHVQTDDSDQWKVQYQNLNLVLMEMEVA